MITIGNAYKNAGLPVEFKHVIAIDAALFILPYAGSNPDMSQLNTTAYRQMCNIESGDNVLHLVAVNEKEALDAHATLHYLARKEGRAPNSLEIKVMNQPGNAPDAGKYAALITDRPHVFSGKLDAHNIVAPQSTVFARHFGR